jgi:hypothetical protein
MGDSVFRQLEYHFGLLPILPLLSSLTCDPSEMLWLVSSPLSCLTFSGCGNSQILRACLNVLACRNKTLEHLSILTTDSSRLAMPIVHLKGLRSLTVPNVDLDDIFWISSLPRLAKLDIVLDSDFVPDECLAEPLFRSLTDFAVRGTFKQITKILMYIVPGTLKSVALRVKDGVNCEQWHRCLRTIVSPLLHSIDIELATFDHERDTQLWLQQAFGPLLPLRQLQNVKFRYSKSSFTNMAISYIASTWPNLTTLDLFDAELTFRSLHILATTCPHLIYLGLEIETRNLNDIEPPPRLTHGLQTWDARTTRGSLLLLARYVHRLFPYLICVKSATVNDTEHHLPALILLCQDSFQAGADTLSRPAKRGLASAI